MRGVEGRPGQEAHQQFKAGLPGNSSGEQRGSDQSKNTLISPLAANVVRLMEQTRQAIERRGDTEFYPQFWMYDKILSIVNDYSPDWRRRVQSEGFRRFAQKTRNNINDINLRGELSDNELEERQQFFRDIATAYGIAAYSQFTPMQKDQFRDELKEDLRNSNIGTVILTEQQRVVLQHIATTTNTLVDPDQEEYDFDTVLIQPEITEEEMDEDPRYDTW